MPWHTEKKAWFIHNDLEEVWNGEAWSKSFCDATIYSDEQEAQDVVEALRDVFLLWEIDYNPMYESYFIEVEVKEFGKRTERWFFTGNPEHTFTGYEGRAKLFYEYGRAESLATFFAVQSGCDPNVRVFVRETGRHGTLCKKPPFTRDEQKAWSAERREEREYREAWEEFMEKEREIEADPKRSGGDAVETD